jgi:hypothetical protein
MPADPTRLVAAADLRLPLIGFYDAPDPEAFAPLVQPDEGSTTCMFAFFPRWQEGATLHLTPERFGCGGAGRALCAVETRTRSQMVDFLVGQEGLKATRELMAEWLDARPPYRPRHGHILIGPLRPAQDRYLKTVTFYVTPDQLGLLTLGAQYRSRPSDPAPVLAPFGSGCIQLVGLFEDLERPQAVVGATDIAMRQHLPADVLAFTVTKPLFEQLCALDERSFLYKPFLERLKEARGGKL